MPQELYFIITSLLVQVLASLVVELVKELKLKKDQYFKVYRPSIFVKLW